MRWGHSLGGVASFLRTVKTASWATAVQIVEKKHGVRRIVGHLGSAHTPEDVALLKPADRQTLAGSQPELDPGPEPEPERDGPLSMRLRMGLLWDCLNVAFDALGLSETVGAGGVFRQLVLARIIEPTSKADTPRVLAAAVSYSTIKRHLSVYAKRPGSDGDSRYLIPTS